MMSDELVKAARQALDALEYHVAQTRPIYKTSVAISALRAALEKEHFCDTHCTWQQNDDSGSDLYATGCGRYFRLEEGTPKDNHMKWCCYCGKKLEQDLNYYWRGLTEKSK